MSIGAEVLSQIDVFLNKNNYLIARRHYHCRFRRAFSNKMSPTVKIDAIFDFLIKNIFNG